MTDEKLRALERRWRESGSVDDEAAWLRERVKQGDLSQEMLGLAAHCGHQASQIVLGDVDNPHSLKQPDWVSRLELYGKTVVILSAVVCAAEVLPIFELRYPEDDRVRRAIQAVIDGIGVSTSDNVEEAERAFKLLAQLAQEQAEVDSACVIEGVEHVRSPASRAISVALNAARAVIIPLHLAKARAFFAAIHACGLLASQQQDDKSGEEIWLSLIQPKICSVLCNYALHDWHDFDDLLPPRLNQSS